MEEWWQPIERWLRCSIRWLHGSESVFSILPDAAHNSYFTVFVYFLHLLKNDAIP